MKITIVPLALLALSTMAFCATIYVPDDHAAIQDAIDASANGDTIIVRPGTYVGKIDFSGKAVALRSEQGAEVTTIDGNRDGSVITFASGEGSDSVLDGFRVTNGTGTQDGFYRLGGGIYCTSSSPTITNNTIAQNSAGHGGAIYCTSSSATITNNTIWQNSAGIGAGICCESSSAAITNNTIAGNSAGYGGGVYYISSSGTITNNIISYNDAEYDGGGIYCSSSSSVAITSNIISKNLAESGGGIYCDHTSPVAITNNTISENSADGFICWGGGICCRGSQTIVNNTISRNTVGYVPLKRTAPQDDIKSAYSFLSGYCYGGGIVCRSDSSPTITNNTITENSTNNYGRGGGIYCDSSSTVITNTILWDNFAGVGGPEIYGNPDVTYSDVKGGWPGTGNISDGPRFAGPTNGDYHITWNSPCKNAGDNSVVTELHDFEGDPRIALGAVDMGADEYHYHLYSMGDVVPGSTIYVKVIGYPSAPVILYLGSGISDPPISTQHGDFWLTWPPLWHGNIGKAPSYGVLVFSATVPAGWTSGSEHPLQALVGPWGGASTQLTNHMVLTVE